jgi:hypothetical protein
MRPPMLGQVDWISIGIINPVFRLPVGWSFFDFGRCAPLFSPKALLNPDEIKGLDIMMPEAINLKFIADPLSANQLTELIQIPPQRN